MARNATDEGSDSYVASATFFMIGIPDSALCFWMSCGQAEYGHWRFHSGVRSNAFSERWVCSPRQECLSKVILFKVLPVPPTMHFDSLGSVAACLLECPDPERRA